MQAIQTKYLSATNTKLSRIKARCEAGSVTIAYDHELDEAGAHRKAARVLLDGLGWNADNRYKLVQGALPGNAGYCHVLVAV